ncbi:hypothetical protein ACIQU5_02615 [Streptomyces sp. NPDC090306]|uniref:hypothetical protein n=1 Tax=Streptomyces sp. NPDC090306 TaxID=3365961 RepID=UPI003800BD53
MSHAKVSTAAVAVLAFSVVGCSGGQSGAGGKAATPAASSPAAPAAKVCNGLFGDTGGPILGQMLGSRTFTESDDSLEVESVRQAASRMAKEKKTDTVHYLCLAYAAGGTPDDFIRIDVDWYQAQPGELTGRTTRDTTTFDLLKGDGKMYAWAQDHWAIVDFRCPVAMGSEKNVVVEVAARTSHTPASASQTTHRELLTRTATTAATRLASALGCLKESGLPSPVGKLTTVPAT